MKLGVVTLLRFVNTVSLTSYLIVVEIIIFPVRDENTYRVSDTLTFGFIFCELPVHILAYFSVRLSSTTC